MVDTYYNAILNPSMKYLIGQRVIVNDEICTVVKPKKEGVTRTGNVWVYVPSRGYASCYAEHNVQPLPGGQI